MDYTISELLASDWEDVLTIYREGIATGQATFETVAPSWDVWDASKRMDCRLIARCGNRVAGWAALSPASRRDVYSGVAEVSIYIAAEERGRGLGRHLLQALIDVSEQAGVWTLQASIFPENKVSIHLHQACGFRIVGYRERIGKHHGLWRDTILLERRSMVTGL